jgi:cytochrome c oxidase assembly protein subunit 15
LALFIQLREKRAWLKKLAWGAFATVIAQAVLGGITVLHYLPDAISVLHACLAQTFLCILAAIMLATSKEWSQAPATETPVANSLFRILLATTIFVYLQLIAGAILRHSGNGLAMRFHLILAFLVVLHVLLDILKIAREDAVRPRLWDHALLIGVLTINQIFLGFGSFIFTRRLDPTDIPRTGEVLFTAAHQTTGAAILAAVFLLTLRSRRLFFKKKHS